MDFREREILKLEPHDAGIVRGASGLILRGMTGTGNFTTAKGKRIIAFYVTSLWHSLFKKSFLNKPASKYPKPIKINMYYPENKINCQCFHRN
jgi:hypothetical protein